MYKKLIIVTAVMILMLSSSPASASNYANSFGASPGGLAMGNAMCAHVNDWSAVYYNIAGLGRTVAPEDAVFDGDGKKKNHLAVSYIYNKPSLFHKNPRYGSLEENVDTLQTLNNLETGTIVIGATLDINLFTDALPHFISSCRFGTVVGLNDDLSLVKINDIDMRSHNFMSYGRETQALITMMGIGMGFLNDTFGFGLGASPSMGGNGQIIANELVISTETQSPNMDAKFNFEIAENPLIYGCYVKIGKIFSSVEGLSFGYSHRQETYLDVEEFLMAAIVDAGDIPMELLAAMFDFYAPATSTIGLSYRGKNYLVSFDYEKREWSKYKVSSERKDDYDGLLPDLKNISIPKFGFQYSLSSRLDLMLGYYKQESCIPDSSTRGLFNLMDNDKEVYSCGATYHMSKSSFIPHLLKLKGPVDVTFSYQHQKFSTRNVVKDDPTTLNPNYSYGGEYNTIMFGFAYNL